MLNLNLSSLITKLSALVIMLGFLVASAKSATAWTWVLHHQYQALNTNNNFQRINNGGPRLSTWQLNTNDPDQRIGFVGNGNHTDGSIRFMLKHQSTGLCLNVSNPTANQRVNTKDCNRSNTEQQFKLNVHRDYGNAVMDVTVQLSNSNFCIDNPDRLNGGTVLINNCNATNANQLWRMERVSLDIPPIAGTPPTTPPTTPPAPTFIPSVQIPGTTFGPNYSYHSFEVWIVARRRTVQSNLAFFEGDVGHSFISVVAKNTSTGKYDAIRTYGFWPDTNLTTNNSSDFSNLQKLLKGESISPRGHAVRKSRISNDRALWIINGEYKKAYVNNRNVTCVNYTPFLALGAGNLCNCLDYATGLWYNLSSNWEDFRSYNLGTTNYLTPDNLVDTIQQKNNSTGGEFLDSGKVWN